MDIKQKTYQLIDDLKAVCHNYGMGNDGNEYKVITQIFLYKFLNDKFGYEIKRESAAIASAKKWELAYAEMSEEDRLDLLDSLSPDIMRLNPEHLISNLWNQQAKGDFDLIFDSTMVDIADKNIDIFSTQTTKNTKIPLFEKLTNYVTDDAQRAPFARALVDKLVNFSFEEAFAESYDFFAGIFEYLIKDYNTNGGGVYAEYYTPQSIAVIMARLLVGDNTDLHNIECYDPAAGTGTLLMALAHQVEKNRCTIFAQDRSQKSNKMLKLNLILNGLVSSLDHAVQGDTLTDPYHKSDNGESLRQFDFVVCNPPFKLDFSETREQLAAQPSRFWAGVPNIPKQDKDKMAIYTCFIQHVINSLKDKGKGAIVLPTIFLTSKSSVEGKVLKYLVENHIVYGVISMPSNVFANTGTNVSVVFFDNSRSADKVILIDASNLGEEYQEGTNTRVRLTQTEIDLIVDTFMNMNTVTDFSVSVTFDELIEKRCSLSPGQYFDVIIDHEDISEDEFSQKISDNESIISGIAQKAKALLLKEKIGLYYDYWFIQYDFPNKEGLPYKSSGGKMVFNKELKQEIPEGWEVGPFSKVIQSINTGLNPRKNFKLNTGGTIKYLTVKNLTDEGILDYSGCDYIDEEARAIVHRRSDVSKGDILFASIAPLGRCYIVPENPTDWDINESVFCIRPKRGQMTSTFLYMTFVSQWFIKKASGTATGSIFKGIRINDLLDLKLAIPPKELLDKFDELMQKEYFIFSTASSVQSDLQFLQQYLLPIISE